VTTRKVNDIRLFRGSRSFVEAGFESFESGLRCDCADAIDPQTKIRHRKVVSE